ncbi:MAG: LarC family nickel insertion protein, partial [Pseudomonadota bacterium]
PVPAPATQELLSGAPCTYGGVQGEATTPTGAAILSASVHEFSPSRAFAPERIGYGIGHKDFALPNVLRVVLGEYTGAPADDPLIQYKIEANIDDMSPEAFAPLMSALFDAGALDVYTSPIMMKKNRPANCLVALCSAEAKAAVCATLLNQSTTIGLRILPFEKIELPRQQQTLSTSLGDVRVKVVTQPNGALRWKAEHSDLLAISAKLGRDYLSIEQAIQMEINQQFDNNEPA